MNPPQVGTTQRDGMGREEGEGFRMGNTCIPMIFQFSVCRGFHFLILTNYVLITFLPQD